MDEPFGNYTLESVETKTKDNNPWLEWLDNSISKPAYNGGIVQPLNSIANVVNSISGYRIVDKIAPVQVNAPDGLHTEAMQSIATGVAAVLPYSVAGKLAGTTLKATTRSLPLSGIAARLLRSETAGLVSGAAILDGFRDRHQGETWYGNVAGGMTAFAIFGLSNKLVARKPILERLLAQGAVGAAGAQSQLAISKLLSNQNVEFGELRQAAFQGAATNLVLPFAQHRLEKFVTHLKHSINNGGEALKLPNTTAVKSELPNGQPNRAPVSAAVPESSSVGSSNTRPLEIHQAAVDAIVNQPAERQTNVAMYKDWLCENSPVGEDVRVLHERFPGRIEGRESPSGSSGYENATIAAWKALITKDPRIGAFGDFRYACFEGAELKGNPVFSHSNCSGTYFENVTFGGNFRGSQLYGAVFNNCNLKGTDFSNAQATIAGFRNCKSQQCNFREASMPSADMANCDLQGSDFSRASMGFARMREVNARQTSFEGSDLSGAHVQGVDFSNSNFRNAKLTSANLQNVNFNGCDITGATFENANLVNVNFRGCKINGKPISAADTARIMLEASNQHISRFFRSEMW